MNHIWKVQINSLPGFQHGCLGEPLGKKRKLRFWANTVVDMFDLTFLIIIQNSWHPLRGLRHSVFTCVCQQTCMGLLLIDGLGYTVDLTTAETAES